MAAPIESLLNEIFESEEPVEELKSLRTAVLATPVSGLKQVVSGARLDLIFGLLNTNHKEQIEVCVEILSRVLQALEASELAQDHMTTLQSGLSHPEDSVKVLTLTQTGRVVDSADGLTHVLNSPEILCDVIQCITSERIAVSKEAIAVLRRLSGSEAGLDTLFHPDLLKKLKDVMLSSDVIRYRVYELMVEVSSVSPASLRHCVRSGLITQMLEELSGDDVLVRVTAVEMVTALALTQHGRHYLAQKGVMDKVSNMIMAAESDPLSSLYLPGLVRFFGSLLMVDSPQQVCEKYPLFLETVFSMTMTLDPTLTPVALDTLGVLGRSVEGKQVLNKTGEKFTTVLRKISKIAADGATDLRVRCLDALTQLFTLRVEHQTEDLLLLLESWFECLGSEPIVMMRNICTQPFPELHCSALTLLTALACQQWGQKRMMDSAGFMEWVIDRSAGAGKRAKECKYDLVVALLSCSACQLICGPHNFLKLKAYQNEGPYFVHAVSAVSTEGAD